MTGFGMLEVWFATGTQELYGPEVLKEVAQDAARIAEGLSQSERIPVKVVYKPVLTNTHAIERLCQEANIAQGCIGVIAWMHTFSPAQMWIAGLNTLRKPLLHLHTQLNPGIPYPTLDMDAMNKHQSAHGGREFGFICTKLGIPRKVVVGHWGDEEVQERINVWMRAAAAVHDSRRLVVARIGDNMREVAVTEGNKVNAREQFGYDVPGFGVGDLAECMREVTNSEIGSLVDTYGRLYTVAGPLRMGQEKRSSLNEAARIEAGLRAFLSKVGALAFTTTFENLHGLPQLPGLPVQRLMADGFGFGAEGDWKTAALVRAMKVMAQGLPGGTSFMEDYMYDLGMMKVLGAHMLEICPSIAAGTPSCEIHPLSIGGKPDPVRLVFNAGATADDAVNATIIDLGGRFRMIVNVVRVIDILAEYNLPKLPVARAFWEPYPDLKTAAAAWILAGGAHHTGFSQALTVEHLWDFCRMVGIECLVIDGNTTIPDFERDLVLYEVYYRLKALGR